jgi:hypothetical protein
MKTGTQFVLESIGYREDTPSWQDLIEEKKNNKPYAYCTFYECAGHEFKFALKKFCYRCPDCGHELTWKSYIEKKDLKKFKNELGR